MQTSSADYKTAIAAIDREIRGYLKFNNTFTLNGADGLISFKTTQNIMEAERYCVGSVTSCFCEATFYNSGLAGSGVSLANSYFDAYCGVVTDPSNNTVEYVCCGRYWVSEITRGKETTKIVGYDIAGRLSVDYVPTVTAGVNGYLVMDILNDIIDQTYINGGTHFTTYGGSTYVAEIFQGTCRQQWGWLCALVDGEASSYTGTRDPADLGYLKKYVAGNGELNPYAVNETTTYLDGASFGDEYTITSFTTGTTDTPIVIGNGTGVYGLNPYMDNATATTIEGTVDNYQYYPATLHWRGDPCLDVLDEIVVTQGADTYKMLAMKIETTFNGGLEQTINCFGDSEEYYALSTSPTQSQINQVSNLVQEIQQAIETADGGVITKVLDVDGTWKELVIANNQDLSQATSVWRFNINGLAHSDRYQGGTYTLAMDTQGRIIANVIQTGILQDAQGNNSWNLDTGALTITNGSININTSDETDDIIQFNGDSRNAQGYGFTYHTQMQPLKFRAEGHFYTPTLVTTDHIGWADMSVTGGTSITGRIDLAGGEMSKEHPGYINFANILSISNGGISQRFYREYQGIDILRMGLSNTGLKFYDSSGTQQTNVGLGDIKLYDSSGTERFHVNESGNFWQVNSSGTAISGFTDTGIRYYNSNSQVIGHYPPEGALGWIKWTSSNVLGASSFALENCSGTIANVAVQLWVDSVNKVACIQGRIRINNFSRTGGGPGVTLSSSFGGRSDQPSWHGGIVCNQNGIIPSETVYLQLDYYGTLHIRTTESVVNFSGTAMTLIIPQTFFKY